MTGDSAVTFEPPELERSGVVMLERGEEACRLAREARDVPRGEHADPSFNLLDGTGRFPITDEVVRILVERQARQQLGIAAGLSVPALEFHPCEQECKVDPVDHGRDTATGQIWDDPYAE